MGDGSDNHTQISISSDASPSVILELGRMELMVLLVLFGALALMTVVG